MQFHGNPVVAGETVVFGTDAGECDSTKVGVFSLRLSNGTEFWRYPASGVTSLGCGVTTDLITVSDRIICVNTSDELFALRASDGHVEWTANRGKLQEDSASWNSSPVSRDSLIVFGTLSGSLVAVDVRAGWERWRAQIGSRIVTGVNTSGNHCYFGTSAGEIWKVRMSDGKTEARLSLGGHPHGRPLVVGSQIMLFVNWGMRDERSLVVALDTSLNSISWRYASDSNSAWSVKDAVLADSLIVVGDMNGKLVALSPPTGDEVWTIPIGGTVRSISFDRGIFYVGTLEGTVHALRINPDKED
jgi:outer membrane protein assembly factor BamB